MDTQPDMVRLFFALWPTPEDAGHMMAWASAAHAHCGGRIMREETLHLTLAFLGATPRARADELVAAAPGWQAPTSQIVLDRFGRFEGPRIVWAGPSATPGWLGALHDSLWQRLERLGWTRPASTFRPHVSLLRRAGPCDLAPLSRPPLAWTPAQCVLVASQPAQSGSYYRVLARMDT